MSGGTLNVQLLISDEDGFSLVKIPSGSIYPDKKRAAEALRSIAEYLDPTYEPYEALKGDSARPEPRSGLGVTHP